MFLNQEDELAPEALYEIAKLLNSNPELDLIYTDEDQINNSGLRTDPFFKPDWSPDLLLGCDYVSHLAVYRASLLNRMKDVQIGSLQYDLALMFTEDTAKIGHIPKPLYSTRRETNVDLDGSDSKKALEKAVMGRKLDAEVQVLGGGKFRVKYHLRTNPLVSVLIPTRNPTLIGHCLESLEKSSYRNLEVLVIDNSTASKVEETVERARNRSFWEGRRLQVLKYVVPEPFSFSAANNESVREARGEYLLFLNDDTEVVNSDWIEAMLEHAQRPEVGAVGAKLLYRDNTLQHAGITLGLRGPADNVSGITEFQLGRLSNLVRNCSAVSAACMMIRKNLFVREGMFDVELGRSWQDTDLCLRLRESGYRIIFTPFACLRHEHGKTRGTVGVVDKSPDEENARSVFYHRWRHLIDLGDPYYNRNLSPQTAFRILVDPMQLLLEVYSSRDDLKAAYPEAAGGNYTRLLEWACKWGTSRDPSHYVLARFTDWYRKRLEGSREKRSRLESLKVQARKLLSNE